MKNRVTDLKRKFFSRKRAELLTEIIPAVAKTRIGRIKVYRNIQTVIEITVSIEEKTDVGNTAILLIIDILMQIMGESFVFLFLEV